MLTRPATKYARVDLSAVLPAIRIPTLILQLRNSPLVPVESGREAQRLIPHAQLIEAALVPTVGSAVSFEDRGARQLRGVPGEWRLHSVTRG